MKNFKYIPLFALTALLMSCGLGGAKAPTFSNEGNEISYMDFKNQLEDARYYSEIYDTEFKLTDRIVKESYSQTRINTWKRGNKEISREEQQAISSSEIQFDFDNFVMKSVSDSKGTSKSVSPQGEINYNGKESQEVYTQIEEVNGSNCFITANAKLKTYYVSQRITSQYKREEIFDTFIRNSMYELVSLFEVHIPQTKAEASGYLFYNYDDSVFTFSLTDEKESNTEVTYKSTIKSKIKAQIDLTSKKEALRLSIETTEERTYKMNSYDYAEGDVVTYQNTLYRDVSVNGKDVNLSNINIDDYRLTSY